MLAVKLSLPHGNGSGSARLVILSEERPRLSLDDLLQDCENLREDRATVRIFTSFFDMRASAVDRLRPFHLLSGWIGLPDAVPVSFERHSRRRSHPQRYPPLMGRFSPVR